MKRFVVILLIALFATSCDETEQGVTLETPPCSGSDECPQGLVCCLNQVCRQECSIDRPPEDLIQTEALGPDVTSEDFSDPDLGSEDSSNTPEIDEDIEKDTTEPDTTSPDLGEPDTTDVSEDAQVDTSEDTAPDIPEDAQPDTTEPDEVVVAEWGCSDDICIDPDTGLMWERESPTNTVTWADAGAYCEGSLLGGHGDWRLPSINELRSVVRGCEATELGGNCQVSDYCIAGTCKNYPCFGCSVFTGPGPGGCFWPDEFGGSGLCGQEMWSSTEVISPPLVQRWVLSYHNAAVGAQDEVRDNVVVVRCVRDM